MANNNADIQLLATLDINSSEPEILRAIQILQKRIRNNDKAKVKLETDIDRTTFNVAIDKLQKIIQSKDLTIDTRKSIESLLNESNAMIDVVQSARKAANEKIEFANANKKVEQSANDTADAIRRERNAMESLDDIDYIMDNITRGGQQGNSVFQQFGTTLRDAFYAFTAANILQDAIYKVIDAGRESVEVVKELNDAATSLRMATGDSYESVKSLLSSYNEMGRELGAITTDVSESADEWLRQGHSIEDTNTLIRDSMILSKVSNLESAESTKYLTSTMQGYKVAVEDVLGIVDKLSAVDLESATDAGGLAEAMSRTAEGANLAGISMDRLLGMIATVGEVTQKSMSSIGESYKTIFSRMRDIKDNKLSVIGEDGEIEDLSNVEIVLNSLGIKLRESNQEFRNFQEVLDEVAGNWDNYSSVQQAAIAKAFSGVRQQENFLVMMENWDKVLEYTDVASNSIGTAEEKFGYYLESLEAKTNSLKASLENLASTTISDELYGSILDTSKAIVDFTADTGILKALLIGLGTSGSIYVFQQLTHYLGDATQGLANFNEAMNMTRNGTVGINDMQRLIDLTSGLSQSQTRLLLSTDNLTDAQKVAILMGQGMEQNLAEQQIQTWGVATAQNGATSATVTFTGALRGLWATLMANPLILVTTLVSAGVMAFNKYKQSQEKTIQATREAAEESAELAKQTIANAQALKELKNQLDSGEKSTTELTSAFEEQLKTMGYTEAEIDNLIKKYGGLAGAINQATIEALNDAKVNANTAKVKAGESLEETYSGSVSWGGNDDVIDAFANMNGAYSYGEVQQILKSVGKAGTGAYSNIYGAKSDSAEDIYEYYQGLLQIKKLIEEEATATNNDKLLSSLFYNDVNNAIEKLKKSATAYEKAINSLHEVDAQLDLANYLKTNSINSKDTFDNYINGIKNSTEYSDEYKLVLIDVANDAFPQFSAAAKNASDSASNFANKVDVSLDSYKQASEGVSSLSTAYKELSDNEYISLETISKIKEAVGNSISNWSEYEQKLLSVKKGTEEYNQIMGELTYATLENQLGGVNKLANASEEYVIRLLEENGVLNANEVAIEAIKRAKAKNIAQSTAFQDKTAEEIAELKEEFIQCGYTEGAFWDLIAQEQIFNSTTLDVTGKIDALKHLMTQAGITSEVINGLTGTTDTVEKDAIDLGVTTDINGDITFNGKVYGKGIEAVEKALSDALAYEYQKKLEENYKDIFVEYKDIFTDLSSGKSKSPFDWIEIAISRAQRVIKNFGDTVSNTWESWTTRNVALSQQISEVNKEISLQQQAYQKYMALANGVGLSSYYQNLVKNGTIDISTITNEDLINQIKAFEDFYNKALDCQDAIVDLEDELANLAKTKFDNVANEYDNQLSMIEHKANVIESSIDILESQGYMVSSQAYDALINIENEELNSLQNKYKTLTKTLEEAMAVGRIQKTSDEWCSMQLEIYKVQEAILESKNALVEYNNTLRDIEWEVFDKLQSKISSITSESEFLIELMSDEKMFDDNGITEHGQATLGLHALNYQTYLAQAKEYASELTRIEEELAKDQYNQDLVDRKSELVKLQQESILNSESELNAIKSLKQEGYDALLDSLQSAIDKYDELISGQQDMYEYQKKIKSLTSDVSKYQNILESYSNDDSEESKAVKQKISVELESTKEALLEAEREQSLNDIQKMLDTLESDTQEWINIRLDDMSGIIEEVMAQTETNTNSILETLESETLKVGITMTAEMESIWGINGTFTVAINNVVDMFKNYFDNWQKTSDVGGSNEKPPTTPNVSNSDNTNKPTNTPTTPNTSIVTVGSKIDASGALIYRQANGKNGQKQYYDENPYYIVLDEKNEFIKVRHQSLSSGTTGWFRKSDVKAYKTGGLVDKTGLAWLDGTKSKPELILNPHQTENYMKLTKALDTVARTNMFDAIQNYAKLPNFVSGATNNNQQAMIIQGDIVLPNVHNREDLARELKEIYQGDISHVRKTIRADVYGGMLGKNSLTRYKY